MIILNSLLVIVFLIEIFDEVYFLFVCLIVVAEHNEIMHPSMHTAVPSKAKPVSLQKRKKKNLGNTVYCI